MTVNIAFCGIREGRPWVQVNQKDEQPLFVEGMGKLVEYEAHVDTVLTDFDNDDKARVHFVVRDFLGQGLEWWFRYDSICDDFVFEFQKPLFKE